MFLHPDLVGARPLMVVGLPRCGTTFISTAYNEHPDIVLETEIPHVVMDSAIALLQSAGEHYANRARILVKRRQDYAARGIELPEVQTSWAAHRRDLLFAMWGSLGKRALEPLPGHSIGWYGHKTPNHDRYWEFYRDFLGEEQRPRYLFCLRNFVDNHLSRDAIGAKPIRQVAAQYREAINRYADMKAALGSDVSLFILDDLRDGGIDYIRTSLFDNLGIAVDQATLDRIDPARSVGSSQSAGIAKRDLSDQERAFLDQHPELISALDVARAAQPL